MFATYCFLAGFAGGILFGAVDTQAGAAWFSFWVVFGVCHSLDLILAELKRHTEHFVWHSKIESYRFDEDFPDAAAKTAAKIAAEKLQKEAELQKARDREQQLNFVEREPPAPPKPPPAPEIIPDIPEDFQPPRMNPDFSAFREITQRKKPRK